MHITIATLGRAVIPLRPLYKYNMNIDSAPSRPGLHSGAHIVTMSTWM